MALKGKKGKKSNKVTDKKPIPLGSLRIKTKDFHVYERIKTGWKRANIFLPDALNAITLFKANNRLDVLIDKNNPVFLKGELTKNGLTTGARIPVLPNGQKLDKAFSLFAPGLVIHDQNSNDHWDVLYQNTGGTYSYVYTLEKKQKGAKKKYHAVQEFSKVYQKLNYNVFRSLTNNQDNLAVPMYTLLKTLMRVGNEIYYKANGHKGLTTMKKGDILIVGNVVTFRYPGKDGVPVHITSHFPSRYIDRLKEMVSQTKSGAFIFRNPETGHPLPERHFKLAFERYCGKSFYPHIVRSHYATEHVKNYLKNNPKASTEDAKEFLRRLAGALQHKKYDKKTQEWKEDYKVTLHSYVQPNLAKRFKNKYF